MVAIMELKRGEIVMDTISNAGVLVNPNAIIRQTSEAWDQCRLAAMRLGESTTIGREGVGSYGGSAPSPPCI